MPPCTTFTSHVAEFGVTTAHRVEQRPEVAALQHEIWSVMSIELQCENCSKSLKLSDEFSGKKIRCQHCQAVISVPDPGEDAFFAEATYQEVPHPMSTAASAGKADDDVWSGPIVDRQKKKKKGRSSSEKQSQEKVRVKKRRNQSKNTDGHDAATKRLIVGTFALMGFAIVAAAALFLWRITSVSKQDQQYLLKVAVATRVLSEDFAKDPNANENQVAEPTKGQIERLITELPWDDDQLSCVAYLESPWLGEAFNAIRLDHFESEPGAARELRIHWSHISKDADEEFFQQAKIPSVEAAIEVFSAFHAGNTDWGDRLDWQPAEYEPEP